MRVVRSVRFVPIRPIGLGNFSQIQLSFKGSMVTVNQAQVDRKDIPAIGDSRRTSQQETLENIVVSHNLAATRSQNVSG